MVVLTPIERDFFLHISQMLRDSASRFTRVSAYHGRPEPQQR